MKERKTDVITWIPFLNLNKVGGGQNNDENVWNNIPTVNNNSMPKVHICLNWISTTCSLDTFSYSKLVFVVMLSSDF